MFVLDRFSVYNLMLKPGHFTDFIGFCLEEHSLKPLIKMIFKTLKVKSYFFKVFLIWHSQPNWNVFRSSSGFQII